MLGAVYCVDCGRRARKRRHGGGRRKLRCPKHPLSKLSRWGRYDPAIREGQPRYREYIVSREWYRKRFEVMNRDGGICQGCGAMAEHVHHIHYRTLGTETGDELVSLCGRCHWREHQTWGLSEREPFWTAVIQGQIRADYAHPVHRALDQEYREIMANG